MAEKKLPKEETIYQGMKKPKETVTLKTVFSFLLLLLIIFVSFLVYMRFSNLSPLSEMYHKKTKTAKTVELPLALQIKRAPAQKVDVKISESEFLDLIGAKSSNFPLKESTCTIRPEGIVLVGKTSDRIWALKVETKIMPKAENGKLIFDITGIKTLGISAPKQITDSLTSSLQKGFSQILPESSKIDVISASPMFERIVIEGKKN